MTHVAEDGTIWIAVEPPARCQDCGGVAELRPYGPGYSHVCHPCSQKDPEGAYKRMGAVLSGLVKPELGR